MNKKVMKSIALSAAAIMALGMMSGCGEKTAENDAQAPAQKLIMGTNAAFQPFEFVSSTDGVVGDFAGIDVEIAVEIAKNAGKELEIVDQDFDGLIAAVSTGKIDMAVAGLTVNEERKEAVDFSDTYYVATQVMVVAPDNTEITCAEDLKADKKVGVVIGYTGDNIVTDTLQIADENIRRANKALDVVQDVKNGKLDAVVVDSYTGIALAEKNGLKVVEDPAVFEAEEYAIAVKKGNTELLETINATLAEMKESGAIIALAEKYDSIEAE